MKYRYAVMGCLLTVAVLGGAKIAEAECIHQESIQNSSLGVRAPARLIHGIMNVLSSPVQLFSEPRYTIQCEKPDMLLGLGNGVIATGKYLILGAWDLLTFWVPGQPGQELAVTECGWAQAGRDCSASCKMNTVQESAA